MPNNQQKSLQANEQPRNTPGVPLSNGEKKQAQIIDQQIQNFEQQLEHKSNSTLSEMATQLETVEREMLMEKIDNELKVIKDTIVKPGDGASTAEAGASAAAAVAVNNSAANSND